MSLSEAIYMSDLDPAVPVIDIGMLVAPKEGAKELSAPAQYEDKTSIQYGFAVVLQVAPNLVLASETGNMRWSTRIAADFVVLGKAKPAVFAVANTRLVS